MKRKKKERKARKCISDLRKGVHTLAEQLGREKEGKADLLKQMSMDVVNSWKDKHANLNQRTCEREERLRVLKMDMAETASLACTSLDK